MPATFWSYFKETRGLAPHAATSLGRILRQFAGRQMVIGAFVLFGLVVLFSLFGPLLSRFSAHEIDWTVVDDVARKGQPSFETGHYFGVDALGRDLFARTVQSVRTSLAVGILAVLVSSVLGMIWGAVAGYVGGLVDQVMMRVIDMLNAIPAVLLVSLLLLVFGRSLDVLFISMGVISGIGLARVVRARTKVIRALAYVEAAVAGGARPFDIVTRHIFPNLFGLVVVHATMMVPELIFLESLISFMGVGVRDPEISLGALIAEGAAGMLGGTLWQLLVPLGALLLLQGIFYVLAESLRDTVETSRQET